MRSELRAVRTGGVPVVVDLTDECAEFVRQEVDGLLHVFVPHATAGIALIETGAGSDDDLLAQLDELLPGTTAGGTGTAARVTAATTCCRRSCRRTPSSRCWRGACSWAPGSASAWSTPTPTTTSGTSASRSWPAEAG